MCGFVGIVGHAARALDTRLLRASALMQHRGPDDSGVFRSEEISLAFQRLAIIDLSQAGHQPMQSQDGRVVVVFNGEIYNFRELRQQLQHKHRFCSQSDTEVLIHGFREWGWEGLLSRIEGMFAFAIWDIGSRTLYAARDRMGKKPLYFARVAHGLVFSSTLNSLIELLPAKPDVDLAALDAYLTYQAVPAPMTLFRGVQHLRPAHSLVYSTARAEAEIRRYWDLSFLPKLTESEDEVVDQVDSLLRRSVQKRLVSDVPLGAFLSGGVDSSLVVAMMAQESNAPVEAVVVGFDDPAFDERSHARRVASKWGVRLHEEVLRPGDMQSLPEIVWHYGQPLADVSIVPTDFVARVAKRSVTVVLNGDGGDEVFGGYARPVVARAAERYRLLPQRARNMFSRLLAGGESGRLRNAWMLANAGRVSAADAFLYDRSFGSYRDEAYGASLRAQLDGAHPNHLYRHVWDRSTGDDVDRALYGDMATYLPDQLLVKMDVATMAHSVEARSPFLDRELVAYAARIPTSIRLHNFRTKHVLKRVAERYVARDVVYRRKRGFVAPVAFWLRRELAPLLRAVLLGRAFSDRQWIRPEFVRKMLGEHMSGARDWGQQLWTLLVLEIWSRQALDGTLARSDPLDGLVDERARASIGAQPRSRPPTIRTLQLGMGWFDEEPGGLNRYYKELTAALPDSGVTVVGLVAGSPAVALESGGEVRAFGAADAPLVRRRREARANAARVLESADPQLVASHFALYTYPILDLLGTRPLVVHFQGPWAAEGRLERDWPTTTIGKKRVETAVYRRANLCITLSQAFKRILHETYRVPLERIRVVPGGIDSRRFAVAASRQEAREVLRWPVGRPVVLAVRRLVNRMGLEDLIDAILEVREKHHDVLVMIAGRGPLASTLQSQVKRHRLEHNVQFLGFIPDDSLPLAYRAADISIVPTTELEGFGLIVAESLAAGTPALVTPVGALPEVVEALSPKLILPGTGPSAIAEGLSAALSGSLCLPQPEECERFAREQYDWSVVAGKIRDIYLGALG